MDRRLIGVGIFAAVLAVVVIVVVVARGGDDGGGTETAEAKPKPTVEIPDGPAPTELVIEDIEEGDGDEAKSGDQVSVNYVGVLYDTGKEFDASFDRGQPFEFQLGTGGVIPGWDQGVEGMKVGGRRQLVIPPDLGYGAQGSPPTIPPNATLVFVIDLLSVE
jgi:peptidylprolyl isomerase